MIRVGLLGLVATLLFVSPARADDELPICDKGDVGLGGLACQQTVEELMLLIQQAAGTTIRYRVAPMCIEMQDQPVCINAVECSSPPNTFKYHVFRSEDSGATWQEVASVCLGEDDADSLQVITEMRIIREFRHIAWPEADLVIQPPDGRTLVNLKTNFYTTTTQPKIQSVTIFGSVVEIEATPASYTWHFGDGSTASGTEPGDKYPNLEVTHTYVKADVTVRPSVDVTYSGSWRIDGGDWHDIDETLTVEGSRVELQVLTATPHLVG